MGAEGIYVDAANRNSVGAAKVTSNTIANTGGIHLLSSIDGGSNPANTIVNANRISGAAGSKILGIAGIRLDAVTSGKISLVDSSANALVNNTLIGASIFLAGDPFGPWDAGTDNNVVKGNSINGAGIALFSSIGNLVQYNMIVSGGISLDDWIDGAGGNTVTNNTVDEAPCGITIPDVFMSVYAHNTFFNVSSNVC